MAASRFEKQALDKGPVCRFLRQHPNIWRLMLEASTVEGLESAWIWLLALSGF